MKLMNWVFCPGSCILFPVILIAIALFSYQVNANRESNDPEKKTYHPLSPWLAPLTPFFWLGRMIVLAIWSIPFGIFLLLFPFMLILFRPLPPDDPIRKFILKIGNGILKINTWFLNALGIRQPRAIRLLSFN